MIRVTMGNSTCQANGLNLEQLKALRELMSYKSEQAASFHNKSWASPIRYLMDKRGSFPSGLMFLFVRWAHKTKARVEYQDTRLKPKPAIGTFNAKFAFTPYPEQREAVEAAAKAECGIVCSPTGSGKSVMMALLINKMQLKTLVVVPNLELKQQLKETFLRIFGSLSSITVENIGSKGLKDKNHYDLLIIDEAHHSGAKTYRDLNKKLWTGIYHRVFFTATPFRSRDEEQVLMESVTGKVIYRLDYATAVEKGYIVPMEAFYIEVPKDPFESSSWPEVYSKLVVGNETRNRVIADMITSLAKEGKSTLCLVKEIKHGEALSALTGAAFASGINEDTGFLIGAFNARKLTALIGTTGVIGEGIDSRPAEYVIIAGLGKSRNLLIQNFGRGFRAYPGKESCKIILVKDKSNKFTIRHFNAQVKLLEDEYGIKPVKLDI